MTMEDVAKHLVEAIRSAQIYQEPWEHLVIEEIFPAEFYATIQAMLPSINSMTPLSQKSKDRFIYWLGRGSQLPDGAHEFWDGIWNEIFPALKDVLEEKFGLIGKGNSFGGEVVYDRPGYALGPHTDLPERLITAVFYLPVTSASVGHGTHLCRATGAFKDGDPKGRGHHWSEGFVTVKQVPYKPNTALFFPRTDFSFHAVGETPVERWSLAFDVFV